MSYMLLIMEPPGQRLTRTEEEGREVYARMLKYAEELQAKGILRACESLKSLSSASRIQIRGGKATMLDGPFAEAKEMVGGFFLLDCKTKAEAIAYAKNCPAAQWCTVEIREVAPCYE